MGSIGAVNGEKTLAGWVHPASGEDYRIKEYYDSKQDKIQMGVLHPSKDVSVFPQTFNSYKEVLAALNAEHKKSK